MKNMKKILAIVMVFAVMINVYPTVFAEDIEGPEPANKPTHIVASRDERGTDMLFAWYSDSAPEANVSPVESVAWVAKKSDMDDRFPFDQAVKYTGAPVAAKIPSGKYANKVSVSGLAASTEYVYVVGNGLTGNWSEVGSFKTDAGAGVPFSFLYVADAQTDNATKALAWKETLAKALVRTPEASFVVHDGDQTQNSNVAPDWDFFFTPQEEFLKIPVMPSLGNHDVVINGPGYVVDSEAYNQHFNLPENGVTTGSYWYEYGDALFVVLDTESLGDRSCSDQIEWMRRVVADHPHKWLIITMHQTLYSVGWNMWNDHQYVENRRAALIPVFDELGVDLVLQGHDHSYMRSYFMKGGEPQTVEFQDGYVVDPKGVLYLTSGTPGGRDAGNDRYDEIPPVIPSLNLNWADIHYSDFSMYAVIDVTPDTLVIRAYDTRGGQTDGDVFDVCQIKKTSLAVTTDTDGKTLGKGDRFGVDIGFLSSVNSNTAVLTFAYDKDKFVYENYTAPAGATLLNAERGEGVVKLTLMIPDYNVSALGRVLFAAKTDANLGSEESAVGVTVQYVLKAPDGTKTIETNTGSASVYASDKKPDSSNVTLITLSDAIEVFGLTSSAPNWGQIRYFDMNGNGAIDIGDIAHIARLAV
jgi:hypothetical protein